jgi:hypothetical protein
MDMQIGDEFHISNSLAQAMAHFKFFICVKMWDFEKLFVLDADNNGITLGAALGSGYLYGLLRRGLQTR